MQHFLIEGCKGYREDNLGSQGTEDQQIAYFFFKFSYVSMMAEIQFSYSESYSESTTR